MKTVAASIVVLFTTVLLAAPAAMACETCGCRDAHTPEHHHAATQACDPTTCPDCGDAVKASQAGAATQAATTQAETQPDAKSHDCPHCAAAEKTAQADAAATQRHEHHHAHGRHHAPHAYPHAMKWNAIEHLVAVLQPTEGNDVTGTVHFMQEETGILITISVQGLTPNAKHAIHIHAFGDLTDKAGKATGGHYNPEGHDHSLPETDERHAGDLGNLEADHEGNAVKQMTVNNITLVGLHNPIIGRGVIVHAKEDDGGQPTGNAGARIAQGVIGIAKPE